MRLVDLPPARPVPVLNNCFIRATQAHRPLLERWLEMVHDPRYLQAQALPFYKSLSPSHMSLASYQGKQYGLAFSAESSFLLYNKSLFKQARHHCWLLESA